jgi:hypothetical protein
MITAMVPVTEAVLFTLGCIAIHALRRHADTVTATLACFATLLVLLLGIVYAPEPFTQIQTASVGDFVITDPALY